MVMKKIINLQFKLQFLQQIQILLFQVSETTQRPVLASSTCRNVSVNLSLHRFCPCCCLLSSIFIKRYSQRSVCTRVMQGNHCLCSPQKFLFGGSSLILSAIVYFLIIHVKKRFFTSSSSLFCSVDLQ